jgi:hypothetical protein
MARASAFQFLPGATAVSNSQLQSYRRPRLQRVALVLAITMLSFVARAAPADTDAAAEPEIRHLLSHLGSAECEFNRNGGWHAPQKARAHLERKYAYLKRRRWNGSAEEFIATVASRSSLSGKPYLVRCGNAAPRPSEEWFRAELARYRAAAKRK